MTATRVEPALLTLEQAAARLATSVRFLRRLRAERRLPFVKIGKHLRVSVADLDAFIAACREEPLAPLEFSTDAASTCRAHPNP